MFGFGKLRSYLGIDLGAGGVKLVELRNEKKRAVLHTYGFTESAQDIHQLLFKQEAAEENVGLRPIEQKPATAPVILVDQSKITAYASIIRAVCDEAKVQSKIAVASLPVSTVFHAIVTLPMVKREEFDRIMRAEI